MLFLAEQGIPVDVVAWVGASTGVLALLWNVYTWWRSGPQLLIRLLPGMQPLRGPPDRVLLFVEVRNIGDRATTLRQAFITRHTSRWSYIFRPGRPQRGQAIPQFGTDGQDLPHRLEPGDAWSGSLQETPAMHEFASEGIVSFEIHHAASRRPVRSRLRFPSGHGEETANSPAPAPSAEVSTADEELTNEQGA